jgi:hypothetical protein
MKIELKRISFNERMSNETNCFVADLIIDGKKVGSCQNNGHGGNTYYQGDSKESNRIIGECEDYYKKLPKIKIGGNLIYPDGFEMDQTLESAIDDLLEDFLKERENKKKIKLMEKSIMFGVPNGNSYRVISWGKNELRNIPLVRLQQTVDDVRKKYCKDGVVILNTNLEKLGVV